MIAACKFAKRPYNLTVPDFVRSTKIFWEGYMFTQLMRAAAAAAMAFATLGAGLSVAAASNICLTDAPVGWCCDTAASGPQGDPCCYGPVGSDAADIAVDPCCYWPQQTHNGINPECDPPIAPEPSVASVRGTAYEDKNANGKRDAGEPTMSGAWLKLSGGGPWLVCAYTGADATYASPVVEVNMSYLVFPIAPVCWQTTTPVIRAKPVNPTNCFSFLSTRF